MLISLLVITLLLLLGCVWVLYQQQQSLKRLAALLDQQRPALPALPNTPVVSIELLNALELATRESKAAPLLGKVAPSLLQKIVYQQFVKQLREQLIEQGVIAEVRLHEGST
jgi:hypothetical protein